MTEYRKAIEKVFEASRQKMNFEDARSETYETLSFIERSAIDKFFDEIEEKRHKQTRLRTSSVSEALDHRQAGWYIPNPEGQIWKSLRERMLDSGLKNAVDTIDTESNLIVDSLAEPYQKEDKRKGLVIGNVQSGKTANYASVIAKAVDAGYKLVIVLAGIHNNLRSQTQLRLDRDLGNTKDSSTWYSLTDPLADIGKAHQDNATRITLQGNGATIGVVKKNASRLKNLWGFLAAISEHDRDNLPILIIDDESDQATPDASTRNADEATRINQLIRQIWGLVRNGTYVGYTATPFANIFMLSDDSRGDGFGEDMYPDDFIYPMKTPSNYFGAAKLFGISAEYDDADSTGPDVVRSVSELERVLVVPAGNQEKDDFTPGMPQSLEDAIKWFIVATAVRHLRGQSEEHSSMLVHTTHYTGPHFRVQEMIDDFLEPLKKKALDEDVEEFKEIFVAEVNRAQELYTGNDNAPTWPQVKKYIPDVLRKLKTVVDNGITPSEQRLNYLDGPQTVIVVGGGTLSRGLTLEGLFVSYFTRSSNTYDTLLQMGRWFGYRPGYEDLQRIWVSEGLEEDYEHLALVESEVRQMVLDLIAEGKEPRNVTLGIREHPGRLQITNTNKMKHAIQVKADFEGKRLQSTEFDLNDLKVLDNNLELVKSFLAKLEPHHTNKPASQQSGELFTDVSLATVTEFVTKFKTNPQFDKLSASAMEWAKEKLRRSKWNVVLVEGRGPNQTLIDTNYPVKTVNRAPIKIAGQRDPKRLNIRTLMSGTDYILDLKLLDPQLAKSGRLSIQEMQKLRREEENGAGKGLLAIYPISRNSVPQDGNSGLRIPMAEALATIDSDLVVEGDESKPLFGISIILPYFGRNAQIDSRDKGVFLGVPRFEELFDDQEDTEDLEAELADREKDYSA